MTSGKSFLVGIPTIVRPPRHTRTSRGIQFGAFEGFVDAEGVDGDGVAVGSLRCEGVPVVPLLL